MNYNNYSQMSHENYNYSNQILPRFVEKLPMSWHQGYKH